ncbi:hypothetical protein BJV74DRAFT_819063 [Russula compacta]|nr:hypothetical protein BJV74DRAFT_819063 [Russula compacta]
MTFPQYYLTYTRKYWEVHVEPGETIQGGFTGRGRYDLLLLAPRGENTMACSPSQTEGADEWGYQESLEGGWIPLATTASQQPYPFPGLCNGTSSIVSSLFSVEASAFFGSVRLFRKERKSQAVW